MITQKIARYMRRYVEAGHDWDYAERNAALDVNREMPGETVYIHGLPKAERARKLARAVQSANLDNPTTREMATVSGIPLRTVQRLVNGK